MKNTKEIFNNDGAYKLSSVIRSSKIIQNLNSLKGNFK